MMIEETFEECGYPCAVLLHDELFHRCGYVVVPLGHPAIVHAAADAISHKPFDSRLKRSDFPDIDVHGGISVAYVFRPEDAACENAKLECDMISDNGGVMLGFDCAHDCDTPDFDAADAVGKGDEARKHLLYNAFGHVWDKNDVIFETRRFARLLKAME